MSHDSSGMRHSASRNRGERFVPVESSLLAALLVLLPVLVLATAVGFLLNWWLIWTIPALLIMVVWLLLLVRVREAVDNGMQAYVNESRLFEQAGEDTSTAPVSASTTTWNGPSRPAAKRASEHERAQWVLNNRKSSMAKALEIIHAAGPETESAAPKAEPAPPKAEPAAPKPETSGQNSTRSAPPRGRASAAEISEPAAEAPERLASGE